jgi:DNA polymerase-1
MAEPRLFLIDSFGFIFRAYHARARTGAPPMRNSKGVSTEAVYIFHNMVRKLAAQYQPEYLAAVFESIEVPTLREQEFAEYKANREPTPPDLLDQIPLVRQTLDAMRIPILEYPGYEADDVIGAIARHSPIATVIVSSDKDLLQLVADGRVTMLNPMKDYTLYDRAKVKEFMGVFPDQIPDLLALKGDSVDNIPGAPGIGDKGAIQLIERFGHVEAALDRAAEVEKRTYRESLQNHREQVLLSKRLATIATDVPIAWNLESLALQRPDVARLRDLYRELEFFSLLEQTPPEAPEAAVETIPEDYGAFLTVDEAQQWIASIPAEARLAFAVQGETAAISMEAGVARSMPAAAIEPLTASGRPKAVHDWKSTGRSLAPPIEDVMLHGFLLLADPGDVDLPALSERFLHAKPGASLEARAAAIWRLAGKLPAEVERRNLRKLYDEIDWPVTGVLARMERHGIRVDSSVLASLGQRMDGEITALTREIHALAGREFNINSPQQLGKVLFEELNLPAPVKTGKGKVISTAADVLEKLAEEHAIARQVLEFRQYSKLKNTYVDALPALIHADTGRVHTTFNPAGAATGRLSSNNPNLQNIPIRTELGREIRAAFVPEPGWRIVTADYSQIELRLLAHFSKDANLCDAFQRGEDIHTRTASEVFGVSPLMVDPAMRRAAKAVNFGIVYGQTAFGLAQALAIPKKEAEQYIKRYFERYAGVRKYIDETIAEVRQSGVARTLDGRERPIPDMHSRNPNARGFAERTAVNTPLQGSAADLIKKAMIRVDARLHAESWQARMLLQVHDELVFEAPEHEAAALAAWVKREMEQVETLGVPLVVDTGIGLNWRDAK